VKDFWRGVWTIFRRETAAQFGSPMAYIFLVVFLTVSTGLFLFLGAFFAYPTAEMGRYFGFLIPVLCIFAPAATMRMWAEDRKENTIEMLLTFPISAPALVLGKFLAAFVFYLSALAGTFMIPVMLAWLGEPDWGPIVSGYLGAMLVGALFVALGMFISGFCRDQVTAFVLSFLACGVISLVGWSNFAMIMEGSLGSFGAFIRVVFGMTGHYEPFVIGKVVVTGILYFLAWTALFLFLNGVYLEGRNRPRAGLMFSGLVALAVVVGGLFNWSVTEWKFGRIDMTEGNIYSVSEATTRILGRLKTKANVNVYISPAAKMPPSMRSLERDIMAKLDEMHAASGGMLVPRVKHMYADKRFEGLEDKEEEPADEKEKKKKSLEARLRERGVKPFQVGTFEADEQRTVLVYSSIGVAYKEKEEEIIAGILPDNMPEGNLSQLEYNLMNVIYRMTREEPPTVALFAAIEEINIPPQMLMQFRMQGRPIPQPVDRYQYLGRILQHGKFDVRRVKLQKGDGVPDKYDVLAVVEPKDFGERHRWEIARALRSGKSVFLAVQNERWNYSVRGEAKSANKQELKSGINELLSEYGLEVDTDTLMDANSGTLTMTQRVQNPRSFEEALMGRRVPFDLPMHVMLKSDSMNRGVSITNNLGDLIYLWGSRIKANQERLDEKKLEVTTLFTSSDEAWTAPTESSLREEDIRQPADTSRVPLAVLVRGRLGKDGKRGQFPDVYAGKERPEWPDKPPQQGMRPPPRDEPEGPAAPVEPAPGKLILVGCAEMFTSQFIPRPGHMDFFTNCVEALTFGDDLIEIRAKKRIPRTIDKPSDFSRGFWKVMAMGFMSAVVIAAGILRMVMVARSRARYRASLSKAA
jgi:ABC-type transport system involved in multi-copper enzyme maturation permease subunit/ABC-type uncharacterized transport system involved in gliding motility auxiliary subunit